MNLGLGEIIFIFLLAVVVMGPRKLPELGRQLGKYMADFKRASNEFRHQLEAEMLNIELQERAKKAQEDPETQEPKETWQRVMRPIAATVSRTSAELVAALHPEAEPTKPAELPALPIESPAAPVASASGHK